MQIYVHLGERGGGIILYPRKPQGATMLPPPPTFGVRDFYRTDKRCKLVVSSWGEKFSGGGA